MADNNVTDYQVKQAREKVDKLNDQIAEEKLKLAQTQAGSENAIRKSVLDNERERLEAELAALRSTNKSADTVVKQQVESVQADEPVLQEPADVAAAKEGN